MKLEMQLGHKIFIVLWEMLLLAMLCFPRILAMPKLVMLVLLLLISFAIRPCFTMDKHLFAFFLVKAFLTLFGIIIGYLNGNAHESFTASIRIEIVYQFLFIVLVCKMKENNDFYKKTVDVLFGANCYLGLYNIILGLAAYVNLNVSFLTVMDATAAVGIHEGYSHIVSTNLSMSIITFPMGLFLLKRRVDTSQKASPFRIVSLLLCGFAMILSGRRILWLVLVLAVGCYVITTSKDPIKLLKRAGIGIIILVAVAIFAQRSGILSLDGMINRFISAFGKGADGETTRSEEAEMLLSGFRKSPIIGLGTGATIPGYFRSETTPWSFELSYHAILLQTGMVGGLLYIISILLILKILRRSRMASRQVYLGCVVTYLIALLANSTNPYIGSSFDFMAFTFLPVAIAMGYQENKCCNLLRV